MTHEANGQVLTERKRESSTDWYRNQAPQLLSRLATYSAANPTDWMRLSITEAKLKLNETILETNE